MGILEIIPPQVFAIGIGSIQEKPGIVRNGKDEKTIGIREVIPMCLAFDHRALNFNEIVPFMQKLDYIFEHPELLADWSWIDITLLTILGWEFNITDYDNTKEQRDEIMMKQDLIIKEISFNAVEVPIEANIPIFRKINLYTLFWMFVIGSFAGFFIETIWCLMYHDKLEYHSCLIFLPFTVVYGFGTLVLYLGLHNVGKDKILYTFIFGMAACTIVEYLCSLFEEIFFGTTSWDYSDVFLNIGGRVCLSLSIVWGVLAILWILAIQPFFEKLIRKIPAQIYKPITWGLAIFIVLNAAVSIAAVTRWGMRIDGIPPANNIAAAIDILFPDEFMTRIYPKMLW